MNNINETDSLREEMYKINHTIICNEKAREELMSENKYGIKQPPLTSFIMLWVMVAIIVVFTIYNIIDGATLSLNLSVGASMAFLVTVVNLVVYLPRVIKIRKIDAENKELYAELQKIKERLKELES